MANATVNVNVNAGGNAAGQFDAMKRSASGAAAAAKAAADAQAKQQAAAAAATKKAAKEEADKKKAAKEHADARTARVNKGAAMGRGFAGGGAMGAIGAAGPWGAAIAAGAAIFGKALDNSAKAIEILQDSYATGAQKTRALVSEFVPFGDKIIRLGDAIDGTADTMKRNAEKFEITKAQDEASFTHRSKMGAAGLEQFGYKAQYAATQSIGIAGYTTHDRSTLQGEREAQKQDTTIGARDDKTRAQREAAAAAAVAAETKSKVADADRRVAAQEAAVQRAEAGLTANTNKENKGVSGKDVALGLISPVAGIYSATRRDKGGRDDVARTVENERARLSKEIASREALVATAKEKGVAAVQAEAAARAAAVNLAKQELAILQQQEQRMKSLSQSVGAMSQGERLASANALKAYQENGGNAPPEIEALVAKLAPDLVRKNQEKRGSEFIQGDLQGLLGGKGMKEAFGDDFGKGNTLKEVMAKVDKAKADIRVTIDLDAQSTAKQLAELLAPVLANLQASFRIELLNIEKRIKAGNIVRNNAAN